MRESMSDPKAGPLGGANLNPHEHQPFSTMLPQSGRTRA